MTPSTPPLQRFTDLSALSEAGTEISIAATAEDLSRLAVWLGVSAVESFTATVHLRRLSSTRFSYAAAFKADVVQACVVTLEPVNSHIAREFARELHLAAHHPAPKAESLTLAAGDQDAPDEIDNARFDVAVPILEELSLAIDPYPRAPGVAFETPPDSGDRRDSPFAVLGRLKRP